MFVCTYHSASRLYTEATARMASFSNRQSNCDTFLPDSNVRCFRLSKLQEEWTLSTTGPMVWLRFQNSKYNQNLSTYVARKSVTSYSSEVPMQASIRQKTIRECLITYLKCNKSWNKAWFYICISHFRGSLNNKFLHYRYVSRAIRRDHTMRVCKLCYIARHIKDAGYHPLKWVLQGI